MLAALNRLLNRTNGSTAAGFGASPQAPPSKEQIPRAPPQKAVRFFGDFAPIDSAGHTIDLRDDIESGTLTRGSLYVASAYVYAAMHWRAWKYSEAPLFVARGLGEGDEEEALPDHELQEVLDEPHPDFDQGELLRLTRMYRDLTGMCLWHKEPNAAGGIARLTPYSGDEFTIQEDRTGERIYGRFRVSTVRNDVLSLAPDDVVLFRETSPYSWDRGVSLARVVFDAVKIAAEAYQGVSSIYQNAVFPSIIVRMGKEWEPDDDEWEAFKQDIYKQARRDRKGVPMVIKNADGVARVSLSMKDLLPGEVLNRIEATVASVFGVPAVVLQFLVGIENSPWSQMPAARRMAIEDVIEPMWRADRSTLTRQLLRAPTSDGAQPLERDPRVVIRFDVTQVRGLQQDRQVQAGIQEQAKDILTRNERRMLMGFDPLPEGDERGDEIVGLSQPGGGTPTDDPDLRSAPAPSGQKQGDDTLQVPRTFVWQVQHALTAATEGSFMGMAAERLAADQEFVRELAASTLTEEKQADADSTKRFIAALDADETMRDAWLEASVPVVRETGKRATENVAARVGLSFDVLEPGLEAYVQQHAANLVTQVTDTTKKNVKNALAAGVEAGEGVPQLAKRLEEAGAFAPSRAELIARTEATSVTNAAGRESLSAWQKTSERRVEKSWLSARDSRVRPAHQALDSGKYIPVDDVFANGLSEPGEPNCRCTLLYRVTDE